MSPTTTPTHPFERLDLIRPLIESQTLSPKDLLALSLTNKTVLRLIYQETRRLKIKSTSFINNRRNPLWCYIERDDAKSLKAALKLADFENDTTSLNGRVLRASNGMGVHLLLKCCIEQGAARCLRVLMEWADDPATPFGYDAEFVYELARGVAFERGRLECLLALHDGDKQGQRFPPSEPTFVMLLVQARSPAAVAWLARRLPRDTDYLAVLVEVCSCRATQPAVVEVVLDLVREEMVRGEVKPTPARPNTFVHAVAAAASVLHLPVVEMLLRRGAKVFFDPEHCWVPMAKRTVPNPLHCALSHPLPTQPEEKDNRNRSPDVAKLKQLFLRQARYTASSMLIAAHYLLAQAFTETELAAEMTPFSGECDKIARVDRLMPDLLDEAAMVYLHNLRVFLLGNLRWLLLSASGDGKGRRLRKELLMPAKPGRKTAWSVTDAAMAMAGNYLLQSPPPPQDFDLDGDDDEAKKQMMNPYGFQDETHLPVAWRSRLVSSEVRAKLAEQEIVLPPKLEEVWCLLATPTTREVAGRYLKISPEDSVAEREKKNEVVKFDTAAKKKLLWELLVAEERGVDETGTTDEKKVEGEVEGEVEGGSRSSSQAGRQMKPGLHVDIHPWERRAPVETESDSEWETVLTPTTDSDIDDLFWTEEHGE